MLFLLTQHCTMGCPHCMSDSTPEGTHASKAVIEGFIKFARKLDTTKVCISGGEPTSHPKFFSHFERISKSLPGARIWLMSNGQFLKNKELTVALSRLQRRYSFILQVCSIEGLYPEYSIIRPLYEEFSSLFSRIYFIDSLNTFEKNLGRAKHHDVSAFDPKNIRPACGCFNLHNISRGTGSLKETINLLDSKTTTNSCKPMIDSKGFIHPGESIDCRIIGHVNKNTLSKLHRELSTTEPCGFCGNSTQLEEILAKTPADYIMRLSK